MAEHIPPTGPDADIPEVAHQPSRRISTVWMIPIVAALIGGFLGVKAIIEKGPTITISFKTAVGLEKGKTKIKYRHVDIGVVEDLWPNPDLKSVTVTATMDNKAKEHLTEKARFWVVRPRFGATGISGLGTLVSGAFIEMDPGKGGKNKIRTFKGLEIPPVVQSETPGNKYLLKAEKLGSYSRGSPIYYRGIKVGEVLSYKLSKDNRKVFVRIFVNEPHHKMVRQSTRFWNASGIQVSLDADGMKVKAESLQSLVIGGISFDTPTSLADGKPAKAGTAFPLYESREDVKEASYTRRYSWVLFFEGSVRGLTVGAPVELHGIKIGEVDNVRLEFNPDTLKSRIRVLIAIVPDRAVLSGGTPEEDATPRTAETHRKAMQNLIKRGLRARLKMGSLLTGQLLVELAMEPKKPAKYFSSGKTYPEIPTIPGGAEGVSGAIAGLVAKIESLPLEDLAKELVGTFKGTNKIANSPELLSSVKNLDKTLKNLNEFVKNAERKTLPKAVAALTEAEKTLKTVRGALSQDSPLRYNLEDMLQELAAAARSIRILAAYLERNPNALIYGKGQKAPTP